MIKAYLEKTLVFHISSRYFDLNLPEKIITDARIRESGSPKMIHTGGYDAKLKIRLSKTT